MPNVRTQHDSTPRYDIAALEADLIASIGSAIYAVLDGGETVRLPRQPIVTALEMLAEDSLDVSPETVLTADLTALDDDLAGLRLRLFEAGAGRLRLAGALGAVLGLRAIGATT